MAVNLIFSAVVSAHPRAENFHPCPTFLCKITNGDEQTRGSIDFPFAFSPPCLQVLGGVFSALVMGPQSDKIGRKPMIIIGLLGGALGYFLMWISAAVLKGTRVSGGVLASHAASRSPPTSESHLNLRLLRLHSFLGGDVR